MSETLTQDQIDRLHDQLAAASRAARALPGTKALREKLHDLILDEAFERHPGRSAAARRSLSRSLSLQDRS